MSLVGKGKHCAWENRTSLLIVTHTGTSLWLKVEFFVAIASLIHKTTESILWPDAERKRC